MKGEGGGAEGGEGREERERGREGRAGSEGERQVEGKEGGRRSSPAPRGRHHPVSTSFWICHHPAAAAPAGVGATWGSNAAGPSGGGTTAAACM